MITAAAGGLGKAFAAECASRGWNLLLVDLRGDLLPPLAAGMQRLYGVNALCFPCDLASSSSRDHLWAEVARQGLRLRGLINIAGIEFEGPFVERTVDELRALIHLNIEATVEMTRRALDHRDAAWPMHIVNVSSLGGFYPMPMKAVYAASKRFLIDFSLALREELRAERITVTALCPAGLPTHPNAIRRMLAQGMLGHLTLMNVGEVAARTVTLAVSGRGVVVPGLVNQFIAALAALTPAPLAAALIWRRWRSARRRSKTAPESLFPSATSR